MKPTLWQRSAWLRYLSAGLCASLMLSAAYAAKTTPRDKPEFIDPTPCKPSVTEEDNRPTGSSTADALGWVYSSDPSNLCHGYFAEPVSLTQNPTPGDPKALPTTITASGITKFTANGESVLEGDVIVTQPGRIVKADKAYIYRNGKTGRITSIELFQQVSLEEHGKRILGSHAFLDLENKTALINNVLYHLYHVQKKTGDVNSWGKASTITQEASGEIEMRNASYSNASPLRPNWEIKARKMRFNQDEGWGKAYGAYLKFLGVPILYSPYYSFPIDHRRKSGFLQPIFGYSNDNGIDTSIPLYLNLAPNYDLSITPRYMSIRGVQFNNLFRYLTKTSAGTLNLNYLPSDQQFIKFKNEVLSTYPNNTTYRPYLDRIQSDSNSRGLLAIQNYSVFSSEWDSHLTVNYVTDDYYFQDFGSSGGFGAANSGNMLSSQLLNQYDINYRGEHWDFTGLVQAYETLHPINQPANNDQYRRLPEFDLKGDYPDQWQGLDFTLDSQLINFGYQSDFTPNQPIGERAHLRPGVNLPLNWASAYFTPEVLIDAAYYDVQHPLPGQTTSTERNIPIVDVNSGFYLDRQFKIGKHPYTQTLEPELFYLLVPYHSQDEIPVYDTQLQPFTVNQLFSTNAFTGFDRIQNANQLSYALSTRLLDAENGAQKLSATLGVIDYFDRPRVCLTPNCTPTTESFSPAVGQLTFNPSAHWAATANMAWDPNIRQVNNGSLALNYINSDNRVASIAYQFVQGTAGSSNSNLIQTGAAWPLSYRWSTLAYVNYNINQSYLQSAYAGLEYKNCGWALRFISSRNYQGILINNVKQYENAYYVQLQLTGLGSLGSHKSEGLLTTLPGYVNTYN